MKDGNSLILSYANVSVYLRYFVNRVAGLMQITCYLVYCTVSGIIFSIKHFYEYTVFYEHSVFYEYTVFFYFII